MDELMNILKELHDDIDYENEQELVDQGLLDSFDIMSLVSQINDVFGVEITAADLVPDNFNSVEAMRALIARLSE